MAKIKKYLFILLILELVLAYTPAYAQTADYTKAGVSSQIEKLLCAPTPVKQSETNSTGTGNNFQTGQLQQYATTNNANQYDLYNCINRLYKFAIILAVVIGVFFLVIAGYIYMSAEGNAESVDKAKNILVSTITALVILLAGFLLLKTINPDLVQFQTVQPCSVVDCTITPPPTPTGGVGTPTPVVGTGIAGVCSQNSCIISGINISSYATGVTHETTVATIYTSSKLGGVDIASASSITQYMQTIVQGMGSFIDAPLQVTGDMVLASASKYNVDPKLIIAIMQTDSHFGTTGLGARTHNPGNVGNDDTGKQVDYGTWQNGVDAIAQWLSNHRVQ